MRPELYVGITHSSGELTNSATHSGTFQQPVTMNCDDPPSPQTVSHFCSPAVLSEAKCSLCLVAAFCVRSVECAEGV
jgi:hypothetical protein